MTKARNLSLLSAVEAAATADQTKADLNAIGVSGGRKNIIINGGFDVWQRGTSFTANAYSSDRWLLYSTGSTRAVSQQTFTVGQTDVPNNPKYYLRDVVTSVAGASNMVNTRYRIEDVASLSGNTATASFWAKADAGKNIAVEFQQYFGTGGSPSANVEVAPATVTLTTSWAKYTVSAAIPSITGKTIGSNNNDFLQLLFYMDAGSDKNARTNSLGQQSGTFDFANVQLELGSVATDFEHRSYGEELALCQRYYEIIADGGRADDSPYFGVGQGVKGDQINWFYDFKAEKRATFTLIVNTVTNGYYAKCHSSEFSTNTLGFTSGHQSLHSISGYMTNISGVTEQSSWSMQCNGANCLIAVSAEL